MRELKPGWRNSKQAARQSSTLATCVFPKLAGKPLDVITPADCVEVLRPIWFEQVSTASRTRQRMRAACDERERTAISA